MYPLLAMVPASPEMTTLPSMRAGGPVLVSAPPLVSAMPLSPPMVPKFSTDAPASAL
jgi:hypothetical protein